MVTQFVQEGFIPTVYDGYEKAKPFLDSCGKIEAICLHAWPSEKVKAAVKDLRSKNPDIKIILGVGVDSLARSAVQQNSVRTGISEFERVVRVAMGYPGGIQGVMWNAEASWKTPPTSPQRALLNHLVTETLANVASRFPDLPQLHTAYDHPMYHTTYNWEAWLGAKSPICMSLPQVYAAPEGNVMARTGDLKRREAAALASWAVAVKKGWIRPDAPKGTEGDLTDVDWAPYYQLHDVPAADTLRGITGANVSFGWALPGPDRTDKDGEAAVKCAIILRRRGYWEKDAVAHWQQDHGLMVDNIAGWKQTIPSILAAV